MPLSASWISAGQQIMLTMRLTKVKSKVIPVHAMNAYRGCRVWLHPYLTRALDGGKWLTPCFSCLPQNYLVLRVRMSNTTPLLTLYTFMASPFCLY